MKLVFASNNKHKLDEVRQIFSTDVEVISLQEISFLQEIDEIGETLEENSALKAQEVWNWIKNHKLSSVIDGVFADDTGLEVDALGGEPGVRSARYATDGHDDEANKRLLLERMSGVENRAAQFRTAVALILDGKEYLFEGVVRGAIAAEQHGEGGFGYDPLFFPEGGDRTFAEMSGEEKNAISHRGRAVRKLAEFLQEKI